jgi:hypothetical protein
VKRRELLLFLVACGGNKAATNTITPVASVSATASAPVVVQDLDAGVPRIDPAAVQSVIRAAGNHFRLCYVAALKKKKDLAGRVETKFVIDETGHVFSAEDVTHSNVLPDDDARNCIVAKFKALEFPPPQPSGRVPITYPLLFDPSMVAVETPDAGAQPDGGDDYGHTRPPFNTAAAMRALTAVDVKSCASAGFHGASHVKVTFDPSGVATKAEVDSPPAIPKAAATCISKAFTSTARVPVFDGAAVTVGKNVTVP